MQGEGGVGSCQSGGKTKKIRPSGMQPEWTVSLPLPLWTLLSLVFFFMLHFFCHFSLILPFVHCSFISLTAFPLPLLLSQYLFRVNQCSDLTTRSWIFPNPPPLERHISRQKKSGKPNECKVNVLEWSHQSKCIFKEHKLCTENLYSVWAARNLTVALL